MAEIPNNEYKGILEKMPICCVDIVIHESNKVLLVRRKNKPAEGQLWLPGGRIYKNERLEEAAIRKAFEEVGTKIKIEKKIGVYEVMFNEGPFNDLKTGVHAISVCFLAKPLNKNIKIDDTSLDYVWIDKISNELNPYVKEILIDSKVLKSSRSPYK